MFLLSTHGNMSEARTRDEEESVGIVDLLFGSSACPKRDTNTVSSHQPTGPLDLSTPIDNVLPVGWSVDRFVNSSTQAA